MVADLPSMSHCVTQKHMLAPVVGGILYPLSQKKMLKGGLHSKLIGQCAFPKSGWLPGELFWEGGPGAPPTEWSLEGAPPTEWSLEGASTTCFLSHYSSFLLKEKCASPKPKQHTRTTIPQNQVVSVS